MVPAAGGAGVICSTMLLTNTSNSSNNLDSLDIEKKPEIPEDKLTPVITVIPPSLPPAAPPAAPPPPAPPEGKKDAEQTPPAPPVPDNQGQGDQSPVDAQNSSNTSSSDSKGQLTPEEAVKLCLTKIQKSQWSLSSSTSLETAFDIFSTMHNCQAALQNHSDDTQTKGEADNTPAVSQGNGDT